MTGRQSMGPHATGKLSNMSNDSIPPRDAWKNLEHAWRYFALHAGQRMSMFNYFLILFGLVSAGLAGCLRADDLLRTAGIAMGLCLAVVAFTFWKLDQRTAFLIKLAEAALHEAEELALSADAARLFRREPSETENAQSIKHPLARVWTYGSSFRLVFCLAALVGFVGAGLSLALCLGW
jgi:hypothetical protein